MKPIPEKNETTLKCDDCGQYTVKWVFHGNFKPHLYCTNCDKGICEKC